MNNNNSREKKVCIISTVHPVFDIRIFHKQAHSLTKAGFKVSIIITHDRSEIIDNIKIIPLPKSKSRFDRMFVKSFKAFLLACKEKADIYHIHDPELYLLGAFIKMFTGKPVIHDAHEHYENVIKERDWIPFKSLYLLLFKLSERFSLLYTDAVISTSPLIEKRYKNFTGKIVDVYNYVDIDIFKTDSNNNKNNFNVIFTGGITPIRGVKESIEAFKIVVQKFPEAQLLFIGPVYPNNYKQELLNLISELNLNENVTIHKSVEVTELKNFTSRASIGLLPYLPVSNNNTSCIPNKIFEYMASKLAIVASNFPLYEKIITQSKCGLLVDPTSPEDIASKIITLMETPHLIKEFAMSGHESVQKEYNWENESNKLINLYDQLLK